MKRTITVARTAADLDHVNRVRSTTFGVRELRLKLGNLISHSYLASYAPPPDQEDKGTNDFHFAPKAEKPKIVFKLEDRAKEIDKVTLELFRRDKKDPVWKKKLEEEHHAHGQHEIEWDGKIDKSDEFPEEYITAEHSPYKLKLTIESKGHADSWVAWTYFHVLVHSFKLELGDKEVLKEQRDKELWEVVKSDGGNDLEKSIPEPGKTRDVKLISNLFSTGDDAEDNTGYSKYKGLWGDGPTIPIFAKVLLKKSDDKEVDCPEAVGSVKLQWDYEDQPEDLSGHFTEAKDYLKDALDRYKDKTKPKGDNCHKDHGGKRGDEGKDLFPNHGGYKPADKLENGKFPFKVKGCSKRKWSAYSEAWATGKLKGKTGVTFTPSRMAGDAVKVVVRFPYVRKPDGKDDLDTETEDDKVLKDSISYTTGIFQVWREVHLVHYRKKDASITTITVATVAAYYDKAWIKMVDKTGGITNGMADYDTKLRKEVKKLPGFKKLVLEPGDQETNSKSAALFRSESDFKDEVKAEKGWSNKRYKRWKKKRGAWDDYLEAAADKAVPRALDDYMVATDGINIFQFNKYWRTTDAVESGTYGFASTDFPSGSRTKAAYLQTRMTYGGTDHSSLEQTTTHEIGHTLFLPHTASEGGPEALHDEETHWNNCTMSYNYDKERKFCGLCLLRLRGWDPTHLDKDRTKNKKT